MIHHKVFSPAIPPVHRSAAWIAHNASMAHKRTLLTGERPRIGANYQPKLQPEPALFVPAPKPKVAFMQKVKDVLALIGCVTVLAVLMQIGHVVGM